MSEQFCAACGQENPAEARFCLACGEALAETKSAGEERKVVSVLFVDLVGFTGRSDGADPEDVRAALRPYHERLKTEIERFGGTVEKFIGDAVMAVFGAPVAHEDDAERAVRAALRILESIEDLNVQRNLDLSVRAGVATGQAVVALGSRPERGEGIATGDIVNTAARLQSAAPVGSVILDETTLRAVGGAIETEALEPVIAKGKAEPIPVWRATGARSRYGVDAAPEAATPFLGRDRELALLVATFERALEEPSVQLVTVVGEPGLGKSRLVWEFSKEVDQQAELVRWRQGRCLPYGDGITFWALGEIVKAEAGILESDSPARAQAKLEAALVGVVPDDERIWLLERLAPLVGSQDDVAGVSREESFTAWKRYVEALAAQRPLVLALEDLHWADSALLAFVEHLLDWAAPVPLLVVGTARPELYEERPDWGGGRRNSATIGLSPLSGDDTARLVTALLRHSVLPAEVQAVLLERAGGNPLYTEQFVHVFEERGSADGITLPETVQALIAARIDTLAPSAKSALQDAAVLGKVFWTGALAAMGGRSRMEVLEAVRELVRREFVRPARASSMLDEEEFSFWHVLVCDVGYEQIPRELRAQKHLQAAAWIEETAEDRVSDHAEILVHHYGQAIDLLRAVGEETEASDLEGRLASFLVLAGDRAMSLDMTAAEASYRRALDLSTREGRARVLVKLADALQEQGRLIESEQAYEDAIPALDDHAAAVAKLGLARAFWRHGETTRAHELTLQAIPVLERDPGPDLVVAYGRAAGEDSMGGRQREAIAWAEKGIALATELGVENTVRHLQFRGLAHVAQGDFSGLDDLRTALALSLRLGLGIETATSYGNLGEMVAQFDGVAAGLALVDAGHEFARQRGLTHHEMWTRAARLHFLYHLGEWDELLRESEDVLRWDREQGRTQIEVNALIASAPVHAQRGNLAEAARQVAIFLPRAREIADPQALVPALVGAAFVAALRGELETAADLVVEYEREGLWDMGGLPSALLVCVAAGRMELADALLERASNAVPTPVSIHALRTGKGIVAESRGQKDEAARLYEEAAAGWREWGSVVALGYTLLGLGRCRGDEGARREGVEIFERLRAVPFTAIAA